MQSRWPCKSLEEARYLAPEALSEASEKPPTQEGVPALVRILTWLAPPWWKSAPKKVIV